MAIDAMKILGSLLNSGALSKGSGSNILGSVLGSVLGGGGQQRGTSDAGGLGDMLGGLLGGGSSASAGGGMADMLGGLLGGGGGKSGGGLGDLIGAAMKQFGAAPPGMKLADIEPAVEPEQANEQATIMIRAMINAAKADGRVDDEEQRHIIEGLGEDITPEEVAFVQDELAAPVDVSAFVRSVPRGAEAQVYLASLMAIDLDTNPEAQYLHQLAQGMGLNPAEVNQLHEQLQVPKLYS
jgi:uncharacterized membrane protein YebE (DUF533 family)